MPALNFQKQFAEAVESGKKCQTIRALRKDKRNPKVGDTLYLYMGMRTRGCRKLGEATCISTEPFSIDGVKARGMDWLEAEARVGNRLQDLEELAAEDGFAGACEMLDWFEKTHGLPFEGLLIRWSAPNES